ncbi:alpha/beta hydrolase, partial [Phenylobacterium sp.]|uniref:alpha/beta fold hydrolase n=1 Tax=Phenylobacterium sp. TaxID=1871053 RepID=UPI00286A0389
MNQLPIGGGQLEYEVIDLTPPWQVDPPTVVFHHGIGADMGIWSAWLPLLSASFRLVRFSMRGFGDSTLPSPEFDWSLDSFSSDLIAVADATRTRKFHLIAESFGGTIALNTALQQSARVQSLTLLSTPHRGASVKPVAGWPELAASPQGMRQWNDQMLAGRFGEGDLSPAALDWFRQVQERTDPILLRRIAQLISGIDLTPQLPRLETPVLLISGDGSPYVGVEQVAALHKLLRASQVYILPNARHGIAFSHAAQCAQAFLTFAAAQ